MSIAQNIEKNASTEEQIKDAARRVFTRKGYAATRTRDIAEEAGYNLALINYYFRSKEKLFDLIMVEHLQTFVHSITGILNDEQTSFPEKINILVSHYIDMLIKNPQLPMFILREINEDPAKLVEKLKFNTRGPEELYIVKQWKEMAELRQGLKINPIHMMINMVSLTVFPFIASPMLRNRTGMNIDEFNALMLERKKLIPMWANAMIMSTMNMSAADTKETE